MGFVVLMEIKNKTIFWALPLLFCRLLLPYSRSEYFSMEIETSCSSERQVKLRGVLTHKTKVLENSYFHINCLS
jgi:hypothetical protein